MKKSIEVRNGKFSKTQKIEIDSKGLFLGKCKGEDKLR